MKDLLAGQHIGQQKSKDSFGVHPGGFFFGLLREKTGDVTACTIAHGGLDAVGEGLAIVMGLAL